MRLFTSAITALVSLALLHVTFADVHAAEPSLKRRHTGRYSSRMGVSQVSRELEKRFDNARFTLYDAGMGACGKYNSNNDFIVALNAAQYNGGVHCFEIITINYQGKTCQAQIVDECVGCPEGALDFSRGLFSFFAAQSMGELYGSWTFGSGSPSSQSLPQSTSTSTSQPIHQPSTTYKSSSTTHISSTTSTSSTSSSSSSTNTPSSTPTPTPPAVAVVPSGVIAQLYMIMVGIGGLGIEGGSET